MTATVAPALPRLSDGVDDALSHAVPEPVCRVFHLVPYAQRSGRVLVAVTDDDPVTEHVVADGLDRPVTLVRHDADEISETIDRAFPPGPEPAGAGAPSDPADAARLARLLTDAGLVEAGPLRHALVEHARTGDPLGDVLVTTGAIGERTLLDALSELHQLHRVDLDGFAPEPAVARRLPEPLARTLRALPLAEDDGAVLLAVARPLSPDDVARVDAALGQACRPLLADRADLDRLLQAVHGPGYAQVAAHRLDDLAPERSARTVLSPGQRAVLVLALGALALCAALWPLPTLAGLLGAVVVVYLAVAGHRLRLALRALGRHHDVTVTADEVAALDPRDLPVYTVLVPLDGGPDAVPGLVAAVDALDYPRTRLDVKLLCAADDAATKAAVRALALPPPYEVIVVPDGPRTRAHACGYGLQLATGSLCVVLGPDDRPDPDQLLRAVAAFTRLGDDVACLRSRLDLDDAERNLLTQWSAVEGASVGELVTPALDATGAPLPLSGASTHLRVAVLRDGGAWDPHHLTADADLGVRLHRDGRRTALLDSTTHTRAADDVVTWVARRSRHVAGALQTWLVHARHPLRLLRDLGPRGFVAFHLTAGQVLVPLLNPLLWALVTVVVVTRDPLVGAVVAAPVVNAAGVLVVLAQAALVLVGVAGCLQRGHFHLVRAALLAPLGWGLASLAAWHGVVRLLRHRDTAPPRDREVVW